MKHLKLFACIVLMMSCAACDRNDHEVIDDDSLITISPDITFVSGNYYGDENEDGIAKYTMALSLKSNSSTTKEEEQTAEVVYLTLFSEVVLDAEYALPESGKYTVADKKGLLTLLAGQSKIGNKEYNGSYLVSTINGAVQESKITEGYLDVSYTNSKCTLKLHLKDENGLLNKYANVELTYIGTSEKPFANKAIEYYRFNNTDQSYNRCWYWGEPMSAEVSPGSDPVGEYMFVFSNAKDAEPIAEGQVSTTFCLMDEYQLYGLDRKVKPGVYPINKKNFNAVLGTIWMTDLTDPYAKYSSTASVELYENGEAKKYFVIDGWLAILGDAQGVPNRFIVNFTREDGVKFHGRYDGALPIGDEWTLSDFREDVKQDHLTNAYMGLVAPEYRYEQAGVNQWQLFLMGAGVSVTYDEYGATIHGPGDCFRFEISTNPSAVDAIPVGTYEIKDSYQAGVAQQGNKAIGYIGIYLGAWFHRIDKDGPRNTMGLSGTLTISKQGEQYTIETKFVDDAKNTISGKYTGVPTIKDHRTSPTSAPALLATKNVEEALKKQSSDPAPYRNHYQKRIESTRAQLQ